MKKKETSTKTSKTLEELQNEHDALEAELEEYLYILGVDGTLVRDIIADLKEHMCTHADEYVNNMIADLINLENAIMIAKEEEKNKLPQPY